MPRRSRWQRARLPPRGSSTPGGYGVASVGERHYRSVMPSARDASTNGGRVTIELDGRTEATMHRPGTTILQTARQIGLRPPSQRDPANCVPGLARLVEGEVSMLGNGVLTPEEVDEGWILACQSVPTSAAVHVI